MKKLVGITLIITVYGCAKLMEEQPGTADSTQTQKDTIEVKTVVNEGAKVPERFLSFFNKEFIGSVGATGASVETLTVESIMDVVVQLTSEQKGMTFSIRKDGFDITEGPSSTWQGRLVPGKYVFTVTPGTNAVQPVPYSLVVKEN